MKFKIFKKFKTFKNLKPITTITTDQTKTVQNEAVKNKTVCPELVEGPSFIYLLVALLSLTLSFWTAWRETIINPDAICYLQSAAVIGAGGLRKAMNLCAQAQWPFYSVLIYFLSSLTHLSLITAAYTIDAFFTALTVVTFIAIVRQLGGNQRLLWLAAFVILLAQQFNSIRQYIVRDHGFLAFYLLSLFLLLRYVAVQRWYYALAWSLSLLAATLFRIEGAVFLLMLPSLIWFHHSLSAWGRIKGFLQLNAIALAAGLGVFGWLIFHPEISLASLGRMQDLVFQLFHAGGMVWNRFQVSADAFAHAVLTIESRGDAALVFSLSIIMWYVVRVILNLSLLYSGLVAYAWTRKSLVLTQASRLVLGSYLLINILITSLFLAQHLFLSKRYLIALSLVLMIWVPFALDSLIKAWQNREAPSWLLPSVLFLIVITSLGGIIDFGYSKAYMRQAGDWLAEHVRPNESLYINDYQIMYYSKHYGNDIFQKVNEYNDPATLKESYLKKYDYVVLHLSKKSLVERAALLESLKSKSLHVYSNKRGAQVIIYKLKG